MKVSIEYQIIGREQKYPHTSEEVYVSDDWSFEHISAWYEQRHHNIGQGIKVINIETIKENKNEI
jgi:hypothetical protein